MVGLTFIERIIDSKPYCDMLQQIMFKSIKELGRRSMFQNDNDPKHTSKVTTKFLLNKKVKVLPCPTSQPI